MPVCALTTKVPEIVPVDVIGPPVRQLPVATDVTVPVGTAPPSWIIVPVVPLKVARCPEVADPGPPTSPTLPAGSVTVPPPVAGAFSVEEPLPEPFKIKSPLGIVTVPGATMVEDRESVVAPGEPDSLIWFVVPAMDGTPDPPPPTGTTIWAAAMDGARKRNAARRRR